MHRKSHIGGLAAKLLAALLAVTACQSPAQKSTAAADAAAAAEVAATPASPATKDLWAAAIKGDVAAAKAAIAAGADLEAMDFSENKNGRRPLNYAAYYNHPDVIEVLLAAGADIQAVNKTQFTPLHHAADKKAKMYRGFTPQQIAEFKGHRDVALVLVP